MTIKSDIYINCGITFRDSLTDKKIARKIETHYKEHISHTKTDAPTTQLQFKKSIKNHY